MSGSVYSRVYPETSASAPTPTRRKHLLCRARERALQLGLHHRLLSVFERLRMEARIVIICPVTPTDFAWRMGQSHVRSLIDRAHEATASGTKAARPGLWEPKSFLTRASRDSMSDSASETVSPRVQV